ncbi:phage head closure protein [Bordetella bronchiseptica]|uniref:phage head closure protein n=1 Tax=Bordetella bronchiseptica TaxID=518 RepID=UPI0009B84271
MRAGTLNTPLMVLGPPPDRDTWGHTAGPRPILGRIWANVGRLSGKAFIRSGAATSHVTASIRVRHGAAMQYGLAAGMVLVSPSVRYEVLTVLPDDAQRQHVDLVCKEVPPDA